LPPQLIEFAKAEPYSHSLTASNNYRIDVAYWRFELNPARDYKFSVIPSWATLTVGELLNDVSELGFISSQIQQSTFPGVIRMIFQTKQGAQSFLDALEIKVSLPQTHIQISN
jgi:hypothetical protein